MRNLRRISLATLAASLCLPALQDARADERPTDPAAVASTPGQAELEGWLVGLDSNLYAERERATDALLAAGAPAVPYLERATVGKSLEAADRAVWVLQQLADTGDRDLQLATLEVLVQATRFPTVARQADTPLAALQAELCRDRLGELGAEFISTMDDTGFVLNPDDVMFSIKVNTNREEWNGNADDLMMLAKLRHVSKLTIASQLVDDQRVAELAAMDGLASLTLIETSVSPEMKLELNKRHPDLRVIFHSKAKLGVRFFEGQALTVFEVLPNTPAHKAGLLGGDRIVQFNNKTVDTFDALTVLIAQCPLGKPVPIVVDREGEEVKLTAELDGTDWWDELKGQP